MGMTLFTPKNGRKLAYVNLKQNECSTSDVYSSCVTDRVHSRNSRLLSLAYDLAMDESRLYVCNFTGFRAGEVYLVSWSITVRSLGMYPFTYVISFILDFFFLFHFFTSSFFPRLTYSRLFHVSAFPKTLLCNTNCSASPISAR